MGTADLPVDLVEQLRIRLRQELPTLQALYLFGSTARGELRPDSDVDLAALCPRPLDPMERWKLQERLASRVGRNVDLIDLRRASTVLRKEIVEEGTLLDDIEPLARAEFEMYALSDYARLQEERREILRDIAARGTVLGR